jgi:hypothetical protein
MVEEEDMAGVEADLTDPIVVMLEMVLIIHLIQIQAPEIKNMQRGMTLVTLPTVSLIMLRLTLIPVHRFIIRSTFCSLYVLVLFI